MFGLLILHVKFLVAFRQILLDQQMLAKKVSRLLRFDLFFLGSVYGCQYTRDLDIPVHATCAITAPWANNIFRQPLAWLAANQALVKFLWCPLQLFAQHLMAQTVERNHT